MFSANRRLVIFIIIYLEYFENLYGLNISLDEIQYTENDVLSWPTPICVLKSKYPIEVHRIVTEDGYILEIHRIPFGLNSGPSDNRPVVLLQHGFLSGSFDYVLGGPKKSLAYILADLGYDVWIGNARGNVYSRNHVSLSPQEEIFWDFSWHDIGYYDIPAMIDYILETTGQKKLFYIGHSQGTTVFYVMCSMRPEYNDKIRAMFSLAPSAFMSHMMSPMFKFFARYHREITFIFRTTGTFEFLPAGSLSQRVTEGFCTFNTVTKFICMNLFYLMFGFNEKEQNTSLLPIILSHMPAGSSTKQVLHYLQEINSGNFCQYDYGIIKNVVKYGSIFPPNYNLTKITAPVSLHYSKNDWMCAEIDVLKLHQGLANPIGLHLVKDEDFNHLDYMWANSAYNLVYKKILSIMEKY